MSSDYINNVDMLNALKERHIQLEYCKTHRLPTPKVSGYLGQCFILIAENFATKQNVKNGKNFRSYTYKDEMILDGIEDCLRRIDNFNIEYSNPFAYFTTICFFAFLRRKDDENKKAYVKNKLASSSTLLDIATLQVHDEAGDFTNHYIEYMKDNNNFDGSRYDAPPRKISTRTTNISTLGDEFL